jgi:hypothetical protein
MQVVGNLLWLTTTYKEYTVNTWAVVGTDVKQMEAQHTKKVAELQDSEPLKEVMPQMWHEVLKK